MTREDLVWLAGWLEGEGCFMYSEHKSNYPKLIIQDFSTDLDVLQNVAKLLNDANVRYMPPRAQSNGGYRTEIQAEPAAQLMRDLLPLMGKRRSQKISECLDKWANRPNKPVHKLCACGCGRSVFGGVRVLYARRETAACAMNAFRKRQKDIAA